MNRTRTVAAWMAALLSTSAIVACEELTGETRTTTPEATAPYPAVSSVPERPRTTTAADRAIAAGELASDRARARYDTRGGAVDPTRGSTIGSLVAPRGGPMSSRDPTNEPGARRAAPSAVASTTPPARPAAPASTSVASAPLPEPPAASSRAAPPPPPPPATVAAQPLPPPTPAMPTREGAASPPPPTSTVTAQPLPPPPAMPSRQAAAPPQPQSVVTPPTPPAAATRQTAVAPPPASSPTVTTQPLPPPPAMPARQAAAAPTPPPTVTTQPPPPARPAPVAAPPPSPAPVVAAPLPPPAPVVAAPPPPPPPPPVVVAPTPPVAPPAPQMANPATATSGQTTLALSPIGGPTQIAVIQFGLGSSGLSGEDRAVLRDVARIQRQNGGMLRVYGHAAQDIRGASVEQLRAGNHDVSMRRGTTIANELVRLGVPAESIVVEAMSDEDPIYETRTARGLAANRRAEIFLDL